MWIVWQPTSHEKGHTMRPDARAMVTLAAALAVASGAILTTCARRAAAQVPLLDRWVQSDLRPEVVAAPDFPPVATLGPYPTLFPNSAVYSGYPQPLGHQIINTSRNSYVYRPVTDLRGMVATAIENLRAGRFEEALVELEPARAEAADDGYAALLESQAQFGAGRYSKAAESLRVALAHLPQDRWGQTVVDHSEYFGSSDRYMKRLYALASHVRQQPAGAAAHFLLGWHLGFLGHKTGAARELRSAIDLSSRQDDLAQRLLAHFAQRAAAGAAARAAVPGGLPQAAAGHERNPAGPREF